MFRKIENIEIDSITGILDSSNISIKKVDKNIIIIEYSTYPFPRFFELILLGKNYHIKIKNDLITIFEIILNKKEIVKYFYLDEEKEKLDIDRVLVFNDDDFCYNNNYLLYYKENIMEGFVNNQDSSEEIENLSYFHNGVECGLSLLLKKRNIKKVSFREFKILKFLFKANFTSDFEIQDIFISENNMVDLTMKINFNSHDIRITNILK